MIPTTATIPVIDEAQLRAVVSPVRAVAVMRDAFRADGEGRTRVPPVINLDVPSARGEFHIKTAYVEGLPHVAVKVASGFYDNPTHGLPSGSGLMALFDAATGMPVALLLDNGFLTDIRTAAAGALAADLLAARSIGTVGIIGSGVQARQQVRCLATVRSFSRIVAWSPNPANLDRYCREMVAEGFDASAASSAEQVCRAADLLITATPSRKPLVQAEWLKDGVHITALGSDSPGKQELDPACLDRADLVVVDRFAQCSAFGELKHALDAGLLTRNDVHAELGAIAAGRKTGRSSDRETTVADLTGVGFQDTAIASAAFGWVL
jgi:ornithine cyclodeaminase/alanine dehydrogenase-like protein (mu-crystallin family)